MHELVSLNLAQTQEDQIMTKRNSIANIDSKQMMKPAQLNQFELRKKESQRRLKQIGQS